jgi:hypothetical protein
MTPRPLLTLETTSLYDETISLTMGIALLTMAAASLAFESVGLYHRAAPQRNEAAALPMDGALLTGKHVVLTLEVIPVYNGLASLYRGAILLAIGKRFLNFEIVSVNLADHFPSSRNDFADGYSLLVRYAACRLA